MYTYIIFSNIILYFIQYTININYARYKLYNNNENNYIQYKLIYSINR